MKRKNALVPVEQRTKKHSKVAVLAIIEFDLAYAATRIAVFANNAASDAFKPNFFSRFS